MLFNNKICYHDKNYDEKHYTVKLMLKADTTYKSTSPGYTIKTLKANKEYPIDSVWASLHNVRIF